VYPDTNTLIYLIENRSGLSASIRARMYPAYDAVPVLVFSELTRMECRVRPLKMNDTTTLIAYEQLFSNTSYQMLGFSRAIFDLATQLRVEYGLKTPDALHLAAALHAGCDEFWSNDLRLGQAAQGKLQLITFGLTE
jgi:predicted nucleic acid-binding protein